mmetsp:Transcript_32060/g.74839  ORF Transcript_32060/g.74839 Transcript_32060/m.74839 type:complete len:243 (-) Transcript_32060:11-739(-)
MPPPASLSCGLSTSESAQSFSNCVASPPCAHFPVQQSSEPSCGTIGAHSPEPVASAHVRRSPQVATRKQGSNCSVLAPEPSTKQTVKRLGHSKIDPIWWRVELKPLGALGAPSVASPPSTPCSCRQSAPSSIPIGSRAKSGGHVQLECGRAVASDASGSPPPPPAEWSGGRIPDGSQMGVTHSAPPPLAAPPPLSAGPPSFGTTCSPGNPVAPGLREGAVAGAAGLAGALWGGGGGGGKKKA